MNPLLIPLIIAIVIALAFLIAWLIAITETTKARKDVTTLNRALGQERTNTASWRSEAGTWRKKFEALNKPKPSIGRPQESSPMSLKEAGRLVPRTPIQTKLNDMTEAVLRRSPIRHAPNIQPRRDSFAVEDNQTLLNAAIMGAIVSESTVTNHTDLEIRNDTAPTYSAPEPSPSYSAPDPSPSSSDSGSFSSGDSGSF